MMRLFEFRDPTPIEAFVLARTYKRAFKVFQLHLKAHGGDPDTLLWRERCLLHINGDARSVLDRAVALKCEGLVVRDEASCWVFVTPLGELIYPANDG